MGKQYVCHPRYGDKPTISGNTFSIEQIKQAYWGYRRESFFPESAIKADIERQNYSIYPKKLYVDMERQCTQCNRQFIFFAAEQKYWYETLGFYIDADCVKCIDCRKKEQKIKKMMLDYEELLKKSNKTAKETSRLKNIALELFQLGYIRNKHKIERIA
ncbi:hypothetical protein PN36_20450 [Candidatus Thiomargarita nelsonii]|uniref:Probable zinc-binding domain-containing protein n=1 Tax=Candidatus Thiomargarita nelsonii TaxID=1003181 RepID=A0A0A6PL44_9GAMM|nr:hypothetical protein PN36_20450 [Candidatus Thiomargarita nelsonii]